ncbi:MAG: LLM class flavin-dependent oxidoreductase [Chloroflexota bacterium]
MTLVTAMAAETSRTAIGSLVASIGYRSPNLIADSLRTIDHLSNGRLIVGVGATWMERDHFEYAAEPEPPGAEAANARSSSGQNQAAAEGDDFAPVGGIPLLIGWGGERVTLRIVAQLADMWNVFAPPTFFRDKTRVLRNWYERMGRDFRLNARSAYPPKALTHGRIILRRVLSTSFSRLSRRSTSLKPSGCSPLAGR